MPFITQKVAHLPGTEERQPSEKQFIYALHEDQIVADYRSIAVVMSARAEEFLHCRRTLERWMPQVDDFTPAVAQILAKAVAKILLHSKLANLERSPYTGFIILS